MLAHKLANSQEDLVLISIEPQFHLPAQYDPRSTPPILENERVSTLIMLGRD